MGEDFREGEAAEQGVVPVFGGEAVAQGGRAGQAAKEPGELAGMAQGGHAGLDQGMDAAGFFRGDGAVGGGGKRDRWVVWLEAAFAMPAGVRSRLAEMGQEALGETGGRSEEVQDFLKAVQGGGFVGGAGGAEMLQPFPGGMWVLLRVELPGFLALPGLHEEIAGGFEVLEERGQFSRGGFEVFGRSDEIDGDAPPDALFFEE